MEVAALLSGGVDSAVVCDFLSRSVDSLHTYTLSFPGLAIDEADEATAISRQLGIINTRIPDEAASLDTLSRLAHHLDDPYGDPIILALDRIFSFIGQKQRVLVTGEGADEIFSGYIHHRILGLLDRMPSPLLPLGSSLVPHLPVSFIRALFPYSGKLSPADASSAVRRFGGVLPQTDFVFLSVDFLSF